MAQPPTVLRIRGLLFVGLAVLVVGGPFWVQVLGGAAGPLAFPWQMYSRVGREVCTVDYRGPDRRPISRRALLGVPAGTPAKGLLLATHLDVREEANRLCKTHPRLRAEVRCRSGGAFETVLTSEDQLCP